MGRGYRWREPAVPRVKNIELSTEHLGLRAAAFGIALAVAVAAFGFFLNSMLTPEPGWQKVEASGSATGFDSEIVLHSNITSSKELRQVRNAYTSAGDAAYQALSTQALDNCNNLAVLNAHPNERVSIDPILYAALQSLGDSRTLFFAPIAEQYHGIFHCEIDEDAMLFDPAYSPEIKAYVSELAAFAMDADSISLELLPDNQAVLHISQEYLAFAKENETTSFADFGILKNAFVVDAIAESLSRQGVETGMLASIDGFTRSLGKGDFTINLYQRKQGISVQSAVIQFSGNACAASLRRFPMLEQDGERFYTYSDGSVRSSYLDTDGFCKDGTDNLIAFSNKISCGVLADKAMRIFAAGDFSEESLRNVEFEWIFSDDTIHYHGSLFTVAS